MEVTDCAILLWLSITTLIIVPKIDAASINSRELNNKEKHLVNITRHYEGDIVFIKGKASRNASAIENNYLRTLEFDKHFISKGMNFF